jgi:hypothetical protein
MLRKGKIDESQYTMLYEKISEYLKRLGATTESRGFPPMSPPDETPESSR